MGLPCLLVDSFFNTRIPAYAGHTLTAAENSTDAPLVGAARRSTYDAYTSTTANLDAWLKSRCAVPRVADMVAVDRGHNQPGKTVKVQCCDDDFVSTPQDAFNSLTPTTPGAGSLDDALGVRTNEGAFLKRFSPRSAADWRYFVGAMGAGIRCTVPGLWVGQCWRPGYVDRPLAQGATRLIVERTESDQGWTGMGKAVRRRQGTLHFSFATLWDAEQAAWHLDQYASGRRMWVIADDERADDAFLAVIPAELVGMNLEPRYFYPKLDLPYVEADPNA